MRVGVPREVKSHEARVALTPAGVRELVVAGHDVLVEAGAGVGSSIHDDDYRAAGATVLADAAEVWGDSELVCKVKEPTPEEVGHLRADLALFTFLHLAAEPDLVASLRQAGTLAIAYETVRDSTGGLPLLSSMSQIAGRMAPQVGAGSLERGRGGRGVLLGGVPGVEAGHVVVVGAGMAGRDAALIALGLQARVTVLDIDLGRLRQINELTRGQLTTLQSNRWTLERAVADADVVVGAVLVPGARTPRVITEEMIIGMRPGTVFVDIAIDQGGCAETSHMTTHDAPTYVAHDVIHYAVGNMPGAVPHTSTRALTSATLPYVLRLAADPRRALLEDPGLLAGVNVATGEVADEGVAAAHDLPSRSAHELVAAW